MSRLGLGFSGKKGAGERPGAGKQSGRVSFSCPSRHLPPAAEMAGVAHRGVSLPLRHLFILSLSASQEVRKGHQAHNPSRHLT